MCYRVTKVITCTFMVERGCCKESKEETILSIYEIFNQYLNVYVLKGTIEGKLWHQNKCYDVHFHGFSGQLKYKILYKHKEMTPISCYKSLLKII